jgi:predicted CoA-binding protein
VRTPAEILAASDTIAVVGASRHDHKVAHTVPKQLLRHGWHVVPVNPFIDELWGMHVYHSLAEIPYTIDLVNVFRPSADAPEVARQAAAIGAKALWLQLDIVSDEAREIALAAGMDYVEDECTAVVRALHSLTKVAGG